MSLTIIDPLYWILRWTIYCPIFNRLKENEEALKTMEGHIFQQDLAIYSALFVLFTSVASIKELAVSEQWGQLGLLAGSLGIVFISSLFFFVIIKVRDIPRELKYVRRTLVWFILVAVCSTWFPILAMIYMIFPWGVALTLTFVTLALLFAALMWDLTDVVTANHAINKDQLGEPKLANKRC